VLWNNGEEQLQKFLKKYTDFTRPSNSLLNGQEKVSFLDTTVILGETNIYTDLYTKPTDTHQYLFPMNCHPRHCTKSIPCSQSLRLRRICSRDEDYHKRTGELRTQLIARGYKADSMDQQIEKAALNTRQHLLRPHPGPNNSSRRIPRVITFHPNPQQSSKNSEETPPHSQHLRQTEANHPKPTLGGILETKKLEGFTRLCRSSRGSSTHQCRQLMQPPKMQIL